MQIFREVDAINRLRSLIREIKQEMGACFTGTYTGPNDPLAHYLKVNLVEKDLGDNDEGEYIPSHSRLNPKPKIVINSSVTSYERKSFTFFHEATHHIIREDDAIYEFLNEFASGDDFEKVLEAFCNIGAAEFLIPKSDVMSAISTSGFSIQLIQTLDEQYGASLPATCIQLAQCASHPCILVLCEYGQIPPKQYDSFGITLMPRFSEECLHVLYSSSSPSFKYRAGRYVPVPSQHILMDAFNNQCFIQGKDKILFKNGNGWSVECEAFFYRGRVFGLFNAEPPPRVNDAQLSLWN